MSWRCPTFRRSHHMLFCPLVHHCTIPYVRSPLVGCCWLPFRAKIVALHGQCRSPSVGRRWQPVCVCTFKPQTFHIWLPKCRRKATGHDGAWKKSHGWSLLVSGWRIGWNPSLVPSSARVTSAPSWTKCAPTLSTSRTGNVGRLRHAPTAWTMLRAFLISSSKKMAAGDCTLCTCHSNMGYLWWAQSLGCRVFHEQNKLRQNKHDCLFYPEDQFCSTTTQSQWSSRARYVNPLLCMTRICSSWISYLLVLSVATYPHLRDCHGLSMFDRYSSIMLPYGGFHKPGYPQIIHSNGIFPEINHPSFMGAYMTT